jgi:glycosyltransferase involved in cell wall biosynthesis
MKLHFHCPAAFIGGAEQQLRYLIKYLRRLDPTLAISLTYEHPAIFPFLQKLEVPYTVLASDRKRLINALDAAAPDLIQFYTSPLMARALPYLQKRPRVIEVIHNKNQFHGDATSYGHEYTQVAVCVSPDAESFIQGHCPGLSTKVIANGVDHEQFFPIAEARSKTPVIGFAGRLCKDKGIDTLIEIAGQIPCRMELVGQDFCGYAGAHPNIDVYGQTDRPEDFYRRWWAFISASPHESFGLAIAEAMACACPPVMLDCGGITSYLKDGEHGFIVDSPQGLVDCVENIIQYGAILRPEALGFSAETMASSYLDLYREPVLVSTPIVPRSKPAAGVIPTQAAKIFKPVANRPMYPHKALGVTPRGWYGVVRALAGCCDSYASPEEAVHLIKKERPGLVILGCYQKAWQPICAAARSVGAKVAVTWHASYILNEFDHINRVWMAETLDAYRAKHIDFLATPHKGLAESWAHFGFPTAYFPNVIDEDLGGVAPTKLIDGPHIGILGSGQSWKNMECQIVAAAMIENSSIHVQELKHPEVLRALGILGRIVVHTKTLSDKEYYELLGGMHVNMCVSLSEVYSYLTAESFLLGTPVLTGSITSIAQNVDWCVTPHFEDPSTLVARLTLLLERADEMGQILKKHMLSVNAKNREICQEVLNHWENT